ncbi:hypothetical protein SAMN05421773_112159 [Streptomyces aidingensis]|uniref:Secreted protein n=1 Tax=Streptomyces aidingensis TaxID=910347 RepID=A0A1I1R3E5_9ACTN|nr:hypothetical protein SAMN05421773_112159 [Streptomyces aidingensis]
MLCAVAALLVEEAAVLRPLIVLSAAVTLAVGVVLRRWDMEAGRQVAKERAKRSAAAWRGEERQAELEEALEQITLLEDKLQAKRVDLGRLRSEYAELLRRYAHSENERANVLESRRRLALEAAAPTKALPAQSADHRTAGGAPTPLTYLQAERALTNLTANAARQEETRRQQEPVYPQRSGTPAVQPPAPRTAGFDFFGAPAARRTGRQQRTGEAAPADGSRDGDDAEDVQDVEDVEDVEDTGEIVTAELVEEDDEPARPDGAAERAPRQAGDTVRSAARPHPASAAH